MAGVTSRTILVCSFPAIITLLTFLWVRKKKKIQNLNASKTDSEIQRQEASTSAQDSISPLPLEDSLARSSEVSNSLQEVPEQSSPEVTDAKSNLKTDNSTPNSMGEDDKIFNESDALSTIGLVNSLNELSLDEGGSLSSSVECKILCDQSETQDGLVLVCKSQSGGEEESVEESQPNEFLLLESVDASIITAEISEACTLECSILQPKDEDANTDKVNILELSELNISNRDSTSKSSRSEDQESSSADVFPELDDMIESPPPSIYSDGHSEDSSDSGKGGSDIQGSNSNYDFSSSSPLSTSEDPQQAQAYEFELEPELCGRLIGQLGKHVNLIKSRTNANVFIKRHPFNPNMKICSVEGTRDEIKSALEMIRKRFPSNRYSSPSLIQVNLPLTCGVMVPETLQLNLPIGVTCDVILSSMVSAGHFFVQQPTHPTYPSLSRLDLCMSACYSQIDTPPMPRPVEVGVICAAPTMGGWYRAQVVNIYDNSEDCDIKFVDYGGYLCIPLSSLRQIRSDFMTLPFQASECYLANVKPTEVDKSVDNSLNGGWSLEACSTFEELAQGQILQALVVDHAEDSVPFVHLYRVQGVSTVFINRELVNRGVSQWVEYRQD